MAVDVDVDVIASVIVAALVNGNDSVILILPGAVREALSPHYQSPGDGVIGPSSRITVSLGGAKQPGLITIRFAFPFTSAATIRGPTTTTFTSTITFRDAA